MPSMLQAYRVASMLAPVLRSRPVGSAPACFTVGLMIGLSTEIGAEGSCNCDKERGLKVEGMLSLP